MYALGLGMFRLARDCTGNLCPFFSQKEADSSEQKEAIGPRFWAVLVDSESCDCLFPSVEVHGTKHRSSRINLAIRLTEKES